MPSNHLVFCRPLLLLPPIFPSIRVFSNELAIHIRWPKYWSFSFSISPSNEYSGLISFRIDWLDLLAIQGTLKSLLQHHSSKASILWLLTFFMIQLSYPYMTTRKTIFVVQFLSHVQVFVTPWFSEYSGLISLTIDWFDLLAVQGTLRSLFQHHSLKASIPWHSAFFMVQLSQAYVTTGKTTVLTIRTLNSRVMSLLFNTLSRFVIT